MKLKFLAAAAAALVGGAASASTLNPVQVGASFNDATIGTITVGTTSDLVGKMFAVDTVTGNVFGMFIPFTLQKVTFDSLSVGSLTGDLDVSADGFSFKNVAAGSYVVKASGSLSGSAQITGLGLIGANYTVSAVPEPESYALMLAGLAAVGFVARRRQPR